MVLTVWLGWSGGLSASPSSVICRSQYAGCEVEQAALAADESCGEIFRVRRCGRFGGHRQRNSAALPSASGGFRRSSVLNCRFLWVPGNGNPRYPSTCAAARAAGLFFQGLRAPRRSRIDVGSSVLGTRDDLPAVVHEICRWYPEGWRVVAVVLATAPMYNASCFRIDDGAAEEWTDDRLS